MPIKDVIKDLRLKFEKNQKELAAIIGVAPSTIAMYESGKRIPPADILIKLSNFFCVSIDTLLDHNFKNNKDNLIQKIEALQVDKLSDDVSIYNYNHASKTKNRYSNVAAEITEKVAALDASEQKEILQVVDAILVRKKYTPGPDGEEESS